MKWCFVEVQPFLGHRDRCFKSDADFARFQRDLMRDPSRWGVIPKAAPLRKARWGDEVSGKGKSGGIRIIYMQVPEARTIFLLHVYPKSRQENLTPSDAKILGRLAATLRDEVIARMPRKKGKSNGTEEV